MAKRLILTVLCLGISVLAISAQRGTAKPGYYPPGYNGDTWTGEVFSVDEDKREITLLYKTRKKEQHFSAILPAGFTLKMKDGSDQTFTLDKILGFKVRVYYSNKSSKDVDGKTVKTPEIFKMDILQ